MLAEAQRRTVLAAMGIDVYLLRTRDVGTASVADRETANFSQAPVADSIQADIALVVACSHSVSADAFTKYLRAVLPLALGVVTSRIHWIETDVAGTLVAAPPAAAYLALGTELARTLGAQLSTMPQMSSVIAVADAPQACLGSALAKRALWQALKPIARHLRHSAG